MSHATNSPSWPAALARSAVYLTLLFGITGPATPQTSEAKLVSIALRTHNTQAMIQFYTEAFGLVFHAVQEQQAAQPVQSAQTGQTSPSRYEAMLGATLFKFVPIRASADFESFPVHQLGFSLASFEPVLQSVDRHGGRIVQRQDIGTQHERLAVRDPDGNTIELDLRKTTE